MLSMDDPAKARFVPIGLINAYSTLNLGDAAIYSALRTLLPNADLVACVQDPEPDPSLGINFLENRPVGCSAYVSVGGDIFNNSREWLVTKAFLRNLTELSRDPRRTILFGQSIPRSCHGLSFFALCRCLLRLAAVCVRDAQSHRRLQQAGVDARLSFDTAFVLESSEPARREAFALFQASGLEPSRSAVVSVRAFDSMYTHDNERFVHRMAALCRGLDQAGLTPVVLIQSRAYGADNDLEVARSIVDQAPGTVILDPFHRDPAVPCWQLAMAVLELAQRVIAVRYHTAVLALATGKVPFHLHYSNKGQDLCERLELPGSSLGAFDPAATLNAILTAPREGFDHRSLRDQVRRDFAWCLGRLPLEESS
jgi:polysaccharide pyruvyl transferase WcaK-like protein